ncbi:MAG: DUF308 domain-containing protein [Pseudomonadota bacterium]
MLGLFVAGLVIFVVGLLGIGFGIPVKEFSFGNTLIVTGVVGACTGVLLIAVGLVVRELRAIGRVLTSSGIRQDSRQDLSPAPPFPVPARPAVEPRGPEPVARPSEAPPPWQNERPTRERAAASPMEPDTAPEPVPPPAQEAARKRRNLLFTSTRREREATEAAADQAESASGEAPAADPEPHPSFDDAWPAPDRARAARRREPEEVKAAPVPPPIRRPSEAPPVTILKSGVVDGMAYSLYSDGSIEAQMPEGMVRFASIEDLRKHLEQRGG